MRAAPALELTVPPDPLWRVAVVALVAAACAASFAWAVTASSVAAPWRWAAVVVWLPLSGWLLWREISARPLRLRWDGQCWHWREAGPAAAAECSGRLDVAADLGGWLLVRLQPQGSRLPWRSRWLALGRHALPGHWHALRCAVYSPTPSAPRHGDTPLSGPHER